MSEIFSKDESEGYSLISAHLSLSLSKSLKNHPRFFHKDGWGGGKKLFTSHAVLCGLSLLIFSRAVQLEDFTQRSPSLYLLR